MKEIIENIVSKPLLNKFLLLTFTILTTFTGYKTLLLILTVIKYINNNLEFNPIKAIINTSIYLILTLIFAYITNYLKINDEINIYEDITKDE